MIARFRGILPSRILIRKSDALEPFDVQFHGVQCRVYPPFQLRRDGGLSLDADPADPPAHGDISIDGEATFPTDVIQLDLHGEFDRKDPKDGGDGSDVTSIAFPLLKDLFARFRCLSRAISFGTLDRISYRIEYLSDAGAPFEAQEGLVRGRGMLSFSVEEQAWLAPEIWTELQRFSTAPKLPPSDELLLDALRSISHLGTAVVLAYTAIEVRIATALDILVATNSATVGSAIWNWITNRDDYRKEPSVEEQLSDLMHFLTGRSLKTETILWTSYIALRKARNSFAHEAKPIMPGGAPLTREKALELIQGASAIVDWIEAALPEAERAPRVVLPHRQLQRILPLFRAV